MQKAECYRRATVLGTLRGIPIACGQRVVLGRSSDGRRSDGWKKIGFETPRAAPYRRMFGQSGGASGALVEGNPTSETRGSESPEMCCLVHPEAREQ